MTTARVTFLEDPRSSFVGEEESCRGLRAGESSRRFVWRSLPVSSSSLLMFWALFTRVRTYEPARRYEWYVFLLGANKHRGEVNRAAATRIVACRCVGFRRSAANGALRGDLVVEREAVCVRSNPHAIRPGRRACAITTARRPQLALVRMGVQSPFFGRSLLSKYNTNDGNFYKTMNQSCVHKLAGLTPFHTVFLRAGTTYPRTILNIFRP